MSVTTLINPLTSTVVIWVHSYQASCVSSRWAIICNFFNTRALWCLAVYQYGNSERQRVNCTFVCEKRKINDRVWQ